MLYVNALSLVVAVVEQAEKDARLSSVCPHANGTHRVGKCSKPLIQSLRAYAAKEAPVTGSEIALEFLRLVTSG